MRESERERETEREQESGRDQESSREGENGWVRVKHRTQTKERNSEKVREDPHRRHAGNRQGQGQSYGRANWRSRKNITSFYFTRFPDDTTEEELWYHFKVFGAVREIFIAKNRNKHGRRFGFVRFEGCRVAFSHFSSLLYIISVPSITLYHIPLSHIMYYTHSIKYSTPHDLVF